LATGATGLTGIDNSLGAIVAATGCPTGVTGALGTAGFGADAASGAVTTAGLVAFFMAGEHADLFLAVPILHSLMLRFFATTIDLSSCADRIACLF
jgi:hypothetical protein